MNFQNESIDLGSGLVFCCDIHGKIPKEQVPDFHPKQRQEASSKEKYESKRRQKRKYTCLDCGFTFEGSGSWQQATEHEREWKLILTQGPERRRVSWVPKEAATA